MPVKRAVPQNIEDREEQLAIREKQHAAVVANAQQMTSEEERIKRQTELLKGLRSKDLEEGRTEGEKIFTPGVLGRIDDQAGDMKTVFDSRRSNLQGFSAPEYQARREEGAKEVQRGYAGASRELARSQGRNRVYGATASAQQAGLQNAAQTQMADQERKLFLEDAAQKRNAVDSLEASALNKDKFNIEQKNKELQGTLNTQLTYAGLGTTERASIMNQILGEKQLQANLKNSGGGGK